MIKEFFKDIKVLVNYIEKDKSRVEKHIIINFNCCYGWNININNTKIYLEDEIVNKLIKAIETDGLYCGKLTEKDFFFYFDEGKEKNNNEKADVFINLCFWELIKKANKKAVYIKSRYFLKRI